jgi:hypothetical protein
MIHRTRNKEIKDRNKRKKEAINKGDHAAVDNFPNKIMLFTL